MTDEMVTIKGTGGVCRISVPRVADPSPVELADLAEIARMADTTYGTVRSWRRRHADFPQPMTTFGKSPVWLREDVETWLSGRPRIRRR